jgi:two-component system, sensor histidine kinase PdtaS
MGAVASINVLETTKVNCDEVAKKILEAITKHPSLWIRLGSGKICRSYIDDGLSENIMSKIAAEQAGKSFVQPLAGTDLALTRYDSIRINGHLYTAIYVKNHNDSLSKWEGILLIEPTLMQSAFELGSVIDGTIVAVMHSRNEALVTRFNEIIDTLWLPKTEVIHKDVAQRSGASKNGSNYVYASQMIAEPNLYTLVRFSSQASNAAWVQFLIMSLTPLLILALLTYFYARKIQSTVIRWITSIEIAARNENLHSGSQKLVAIDETMPFDIKSVAVAFNRMVLDTVERENALRESLQTNTGLIKELHHRIKNSLQVIQSYIALALRKVGGSQSPHLADAELKIQVISIAYRFALTETGIRPVYIKSFIGEIIASLLISAQKNNQWVSNSIQSDAQLSVDRIIPLGLVIVEAIGAGLNAEAAKNVSVKIVMLDDLQVEFVANSTVKCATGWESSKDVFSCDQQGENDAKAPKDPLHSLDP